MENLLNRGLGYSILPLKLYIMPVLVDCKISEHSAIGHEFLYGLENNEDYEVTLFKTIKNNLTRIHTIPEGLENS